MGMTGRARRLVYLVHRWTGIFGCILMLLWFISGVVMMYVGYPKLTPAERLGSLPALEHGRAAPPGSAWNVDTTLTSLRGGPVYVVRPSGRPPSVISATTGLPLPTPATKEQALREAQAFSAGAPVTHEGMVHEDRWTHSRGLDPHRPLHRITAGDAVRTTLYVSSSTGQVVLDAPLSEQRWNYAGAWLHWLYLFRHSSVDPTWSWLVIVLSAAGTVMAVSGIVVGVWRWRFSGRYKSGSRSPYREPWMKWHHVVGLLFSAFVFTWIFSGLMSMNPLEVLSAKHGRPDLAAYRQGGGAGGASATGADSRQEAAARPGMAGFAADTPLSRPAQIIAALREAGFTPVELAWKRLGGIPYVLAHDRHAGTRIVRAAAHPGDGPAHRPATGQGDRPAEPGPGPSWSRDADTPSAGSRLSVETQWDPQTVLAAAERLFAAPIVEHRVVEDHDPHYYQRHAASMNGARQHRLPALRIQFADPDDTLVYIDLPTGEVRLSLSRRERGGRWLFYFLHSWDTPSLLQSGWWREIALILLSIGGGIVSTTGVVIGWRRLRRRQA